MKLIPDELVLQCCNALVERDNHAGSWPAGLPQCFREVCSYLKLDGVENWVTVVEMAVKSHAVHLLVEVLKKMDAENEDREEQKYDI